MKYGIGDVVIINKYANDPFNSRGVIIGYNPVKNIYRVKNTEPPYCGTVDGIFYEHELSHADEKIDVPLAKVEVKNHVP